MKIKTNIPDTLLILILAAHVTKPVRTFLLLLSYEVFTI